MYSVVQYLLSYLPSPSGSSSSHTNQDIGLDCEELKLDQTALCLKDLLAVSGGSWPPNTTYGTQWPPALRAYHGAYTKMAPSLATEEVSLDDEENRRRTLAFRRGFEEALQRVDMTLVSSLLSSDDNAMTAMDWNGFFACIALSRHAYRLVLLRRS